MNRPLPSVRFSLATSEDDGAIAALLAQSELPGWISLSYQAMPGHHGTLHPQGHSQTVLARDASGVAAGMVTRTVLPGYFGGKQATLGYLGQFRIAEAFRRRPKLLQQAFASFRKLADDPDETPWYFASILSGNLAAKRLLTADLPGFPKFKRAGALFTLAFRSKSRAADPAIRPATADEMPQLAAFANRLNADRPLSPRLDAADLANGCWLGLSAHDFMMLHDGGRLIGIAALWDQREFHRLTVTGYDRRLRPWRKLVNLAAPLAGLPHLPAPGETLANATLAFLSVEGNDPGAARRLLAHARHVAAQRGLAMFSLGLAEDDPLLTPLRRAGRHILYESCIYAANWHDGAALPGHDEFQLMRPEIALL